MYVCQFAALKLRIMAHEDHVNIDHYISVSNANKTFLNLCDLNLKEIPKRVFDRREITHLFLSNNSLADIPPDIARLHNLECVVADSNLLETLPQELCTLRRY